MTAVLVGTDDGLRRVEPGDGHRIELPGAITALVRDVALVDARTVHVRTLAGSWERAGNLDGHPDGTCVGRAANGDLLVGTREAHLVALTGAGVELVRGFEAAEGRDGWYTPWGGPPDTRSLSAAVDGATYVNVHVGGILRTDDSGRSWQPTIDVDADVHQVLAVGEGGTVVAATAYGLAVSRDRGATWQFVTDGLHAGYARAVVVAGDWLLLSASTGPRTDRAAVYRRPLAAGEGVPFERCRDGLPEWFSGNIDTGRLAADGDGSVVALATGDGTLYRSEDAGRTWDVVATGLGRPNGLAFTAG